MKRVFRRCSAVILVLVLLVGGALSVPASAASTDSPSHVVSSIWDFWLRLNSPLYAIIAAHLDMKEEEATNEDWGNAYGRYVADIQSNYGNVWVGSDGLYLGGWQPYTTLEKFVPRAMTFYSGSYFRYYWMGLNDPLHYSAGNGALDTVITFIPPVSGTYQFVFILDCFGTEGEHSTGYSQFYRSWSGIKNSAGNYVERIENDPGSSNSSYSSTKRVVASLTAGESYSLILAPYREFTSPSIIDVTGRVRITFPSSVDVSDLSSDFRPTTFIGNYIVEGDTNVVENVQIVNETTNIYYNPATGQSTPIINWMYDYGDRSYDLTLEGGVAVKVVFGDEIVQITEDNTVYNVQYAVPGEGGGEVDPTPTPTPEPTPSPSPGPGPGGDDDTGFLSGILAAIKGLWDTVKGLGQSIIDGILDGLKSLFLPTEETLNSFSGEVDEKLPIIGDLQDLGDDLVSALENPAQSANDLRLTTVVDLGKGGGQITGDAQINLLDVSWYLEYKPLVDDVIVGFVWLVFLWNLFGQLPSIIHGGASALHTTSEIQKTADYYSGGRGDDS